MKDSIFLNSTVVAIAETGVTVSVTAVVKDMREGAEVSASVNYRDPAAPEVVLSASQTLIPVNGTG